MVIGTMLMLPRIIPSVLSKISSNDFYRQSNSCIFTAIQELHEKNMGVDLLTVSSHLKDQGKIETCGGISYLAGLTGIVPQSAHIESYCWIVGEKARARRLIEISNEICGRCFDGENTDSLFSDIGKFRVIVLKA